MKMKIQTTVIGSYSVPDWYSILNEAVKRNEITPEVFREAQETRARAALKDFENLGIDLYSDGESLRRDHNVHSPAFSMINFFAKNITGYKMNYKPNALALVEALPVPTVVGKLEYNSLGTVDELSFIRQHSKGKIKMTLTGPHMFASTVHNEFYPDRKSICMDMAAVLNQEVLALEAAGCDAIQIAEPVLWWAQDNISWGIEAINRCFAGVKDSLRVLHICQGNYNPDPTPHVGIRVFPAEFNDVFPLLQDTEVDLVLMPLSSLEVDDYSWLSNVPQNKAIGIGVVDVQTHDIETPRQVAMRLRKALDYIPANRLFANPDCGLNHLPTDIAFRKLQALVEGAAIVNKELE